MSMKQFWEDRYGKEEFAYGEEPNQFLKEQLISLELGTILFPAEGEGRNAVFAAELGWNVSAFDLSSEGQRKANLLAQKKGVEIDYILDPIADLPYTEEQFDAMALIYAHFPADVKSTYHKLLSSYVKPGGIVIFEAFSKNHLTLNNEKAGGPKDINMLFSVEEVQNDFSDFEVHYLKEEEVELSEGLYHNGISSVVRFVGRKK
jgi:2-polyprenyl-3-methyl-5-hydroxy-6-metoxy-1,4-benzoquinol methylase